MNKPNVKVYVCPVCGSVNMEPDSLTGTVQFPRSTIWGLCDSHAKAIKEGYTILVGCDLERSELDENGNITDIGEVYRTGVAAVIKGSSWKKYFEVDPPAIGYAFVSGDVMGELKRRVSSGVEKRFDSTTKIALAKPEKPLVTR